jgi:hypothetical protein
VKHRFALLVALAACSGGGDTQPRVSDAGRTRRVIEPPPGQVRPLPPHAIDAGGVGPYRLGVSQSDALAVLPSIPRIAVLEIEDVLDASVIRTEDDTLLVGGGPGAPISFISALSPGIARTEGGLAVGARRVDLAALGPALDDPRAAHDPSLLTAAAMPGAHFVLYGDRVTAILLQAVAGSPTPPPPRDGGAPVAPPSGCARALPAPTGELVAAAGVKPGDAARAAVLPLCATAVGREAMVTLGDTIALVDGDGEHARKLATTEVRGLVWAAPVRNDLDRDDVVAISERRSDQELTITLTVFRTDGGRFTRALEEQAYRLDRASAQVIGARIEDLRLLVTVEARPETFVLGGVLVHAPLTGVRDVAPLLARPVSRHRRASSPQTTPADAAPPRDASPASGGPGDAQKTPD